MATIHIAVEDVAKGGIGTDHTFDVIVKPSLAALASSSNSTLTHPLLACNSDDDCSALTQRLGNTEGQSAYICTSTKVCKLIVSAGQICQQASDCAQYQVTLSLLPFL
jgi:hypothetical protein